MVGVTAAVAAPDLDLGVRAQPLPVAKRLAEQDFFVWCLAYGADGSFTRKRIKGHAVTSSACF